MDGLERRLRDLLTDDRLHLVPRPDAAATVHLGVRRRRRRARLSAVAVGVTTVAAAVAVAAVTPALLSHPVGRRGGALSAPAPARSWTLGTPLPLPAGVGRVTAMTVSGGTVWAVAPRRLIRLDPVTGVSTSYAVDGTPQAVAATPEHVWVVVTAGPATRPTCTLEERGAAGVRHHVYPLPCAAGTRFAVTANGAQAWLVAGGSGVVTAWRYAAAASTFRAETTVAGAPWGTRPLAIGGSDLFVLTGDRPGGGSRVTRLSGPGLAVTGSTEVPADARALAYGSGRLFLAGPGGMFALDPRVRHPTPLGAEAADGVTTGDDLVWTVAVGGGSSRLAAYDPRAGRRVATVVLAGSATDVVADGTSLWALLQPPSGAAVVAVTPSPRR